MMIAHELYSLLLTHHSFFITSPTETFSHQSQQDQAHDQQQLKQLLQLFLVRCKS